MKMMNSLKTCHLMKAVISKIATSGTIINNSTNLVGVGHILGQTMYYLKKVGFYILSFDLSYKQTVQFHLL